MPFPLAPWLNQPDYLGAMTRGATLALDAQKMAQEGKLAAAQLAADQAKAAGSLGLGYANVAADQARNQAASDLAKAKMAAEAMDAENLNKYRTDENAIRSKALDQKSIADSIKHNLPIHVANTLVRPNATGGIDVLYNADDSKMSEVDKMKMGDLYRQRRTYQAMLTKPDISADEKASHLQNIDQLTAAINAIEAKRLPHGAAVAAPALPLSTTPPDANAPLGWKPTTGGEWERPITNPADPLAPKQASPKYLYNPATGTFEPQKSKETQLQWEKRLDEAELQK